MTLAQQGNTMVDTPLGCSEQMQFTPLLEVDSVSSATANSVSPVSLISHSKQEISVTLLDKTFKRGNHNLTVELGPHILFHHALRNALKKHPSLLGTLWAHSYDRTPACRSDEQNFPTFGHLHQEKLCPRFH